MPLSELHIAELNERRAELHLAPLTPEQLAILTASGRTSQAEELLDTMRDLEGLSRWLIERMKALMIS